VFHPNQAWLAVYSQGWAEAAATLHEDPFQVDQSRLGWTIFCARYAWPYWPLATRLDHLYGLHAALVETAPPLPWLEWELYQLSGDRKRLGQRFASLQQWTNDMLIAAKPDLHVQQVVSLQSLSWIAKHLDRIEEASAYQNQARTICTLPAAEPLERALALLWADHPEAQAVQVITLLRQSLVHPLDNRERASWLERCLLLLAALRHHQQVEWATTVATMAMKMDVDEPSLFQYVPAIFIDGIVGCVPLADEGLLAWWLYQVPPLGIDHYRLGDNQISLHAIQEAGVGTLLTIQNSAPLLLEIVTARHSYLESLAAGHHCLTLTVLDRTDIKRV
jgi:hypothetical protein